MSAAGEVAQAIADAICQEIALGAVETCLATMNGMCGNEGQATIIEGAEESVTSQVDLIAHGDSAPIQVDHPEAVSIIVDTGQDILDAAAEMCKKIQQAAELAE